MSATPKQLRKMASIAHAGQDYYFDKSESTIQVLM